MEAHETNYIIQKLAYMAKMQQEMSANINRLTNIITDMSKPEIQWINRRQAAEYLNVSPHTIDKYSREGKLVKDGTGNIMYTSAIMLKHKIQ
jgi:hypothetical protein